MAKVDDQEEVRKTSKELIKELRAPSNLLDERPVNLPNKIDEIIEKRVGERYFEGKAEYELGKHVHAIMKFFKGVK